MGGQTVAMEADRPCRLRLAASGEWITFSGDDDDCRVARVRSGPRAGTAGLGASQALCCFNDVALRGARLLARDTDSDGHELTR